MSDYEYDYFSDAYDDASIDGVTELAEASESYDSEEVDEITDFYESEARESLLMEEPYEEVSLAGSFLNTKYTL
jgi:hypothetical protein